MAGHQFVIGADDLTRKLERAKVAAAEKLHPALIKSGEEIAADQRQLAESSRRSGDLIESIHVTGPRETTPAHSADGGRRTAGEFEVLIPRATVTPVTVIWLRVALVSACTRMARQPVRCPRSHSSIQPTA